MIMLKLTCSSLRSSVYICLMLTFILNAQNAQAPGGISALGQTVLTAMQDPNSTLGNTMKGFQDMLSSLAVAEVAARAADILANGLEVFMDHWNFTISSECLGHTEMTLGAIVNRERWALKMIDAMGKPRSDLVDLHLVWLGSYDECVANEALVYADPVTKVGAASPFKGRYCMASYRIAGNSLGSAFGVQLKVGLCVPSTCSSDDTKSLASVLMSLVPVNTSTFPPPAVTCQLETLEYTTAAIAAITVASVFIAVMIAGTVYDVVVCSLVKQTSKQRTTFKDPPAANDTPVCTVFTLLEDKQSLANGNATGNDVMPGEKPSKNQFEIATGDSLELKGMTSVYEPGVVGKILKSFSLYTNLGKILNTRQPAGTLTAVHGIRFISMSWVILGHAIGYGTAYYEQNTLLFMRDMFHRLTFQAIGNATFSVDTFFSLSGLLVAYLSLKEMKKVGGAKKFKWGMYYFHRFWRLTPAYMLTLLVYVPTIKYWSNGPMWNQEGMEKDECRGTWWWNLLYINNLIHPREQCMAWGWYLANDMQFYVISPLVLIPLYYSRIWGSISVIVFLLTGVVSSGVVTSVYDLSANTVFNVGQPDASNMLYQKPWCRVGPYMVGIFTGYLLYTTGGKLRMKKVVCLIGWTLATIVALLVLYGLWNPSGIGNPTLNKAATIVYNATSRTVWGVCVCWVVYACATGHGGPVNAFLSWKGFIPLSRLSYCAYLVHLIVIVTHSMSKRSLMFYTDIEAAYIFTGAMCMSYAAALVVSLAFEAPMMGLEKAFLGRDKRS